MQGGAENPTAQGSRTCTNNARVDPPLSPLGIPSLPLFSVLHPVIIPSEVAGEHQLSLLSDFCCWCFPEDLDMGTTGMCVLLVCLCTVLSGQSRDTSEDEYVEHLRETNGGEAAAGHPPGIPAPSLNTDDSSPSLSPGKINFSSFVLFLSSKK